MMKISILPAALLVVSTFAATGAWATTVADPAGDFLATFTSAPANGDLDILSATATFDGAHFHLSSIQNGAVGTTANSLYAWGINRGAGLPRLLGFPGPSIGAHALFDSLAVLFPNGTALVVVFGAPGPPTAIIPLPGAAIVGGNTIGASIPLSLLPSMGLAPADYRFTLWSRARLNPAMDSGNFEIADFAPDARGFAAVPEPASWALMIGGFALVGGALRRRKPAAALA